MRRMTRQVGDKERGRSRMNVRDSSDLSGLPRRGEDGGKGKIKTNTRLGQIPGKSTQQSKHSAGARTRPKTIGDRSRRANARKTPLSHTSDHYLITPKGASDLVQVQKTLLGVQFCLLCDSRQHHEFILEPFLSKINTMHVWNEKQI